MHFSMKGVLRYIYACICVCIYMCVCLRLIHDTGLYVLPVMMPLGDQFEKHVTLCSIYKLMQLQ